MTRKQLNLIEHDLWKIVHEHQTSTDPSHDREHVRRVLLTMKTIQNKEGGHLGILIPAALFHDIVSYPKDHPRKDRATEESALFAEKILSTYKGYRFNKSTIAKVKQCILECSWSKGVYPTCPESAILQDADRLEQVGAIAIMRTFASSGQMNRGFYNMRDPFNETIPPMPTPDYALELFPNRLLKISSKLHTPTAKAIAEHRELFLRQFLSQLKRELKEIGRVA